MKKRKSRLIFWSGGLDSSFLVYDSLMKGYDVYAEYIEIENNKEKTKREKESIEKMLHRFSELGMNYLRNNCKVSVSPTFSKIVFSQFPIFLFNIFYKIGSFDEICLGYVMNDDFCSYIEECKKIYNSIFMFTDDGKADFKKTELVFPLIKYKKEQIKTVCPDFILDNITFCENADNDDFCGTCHACIRFNNTFPDTFSKLKSNYLSKNGTYKITDRNDIKEKHQKTLKMVKKKR